jgi:hypothetical protein
MSTTKKPPQSQIVFPTPAPALQPVASTLQPGIAFFPPNFHRPQQHAPAWFYSALAWLGATYYDASNTRQAFGEALIGSTVDPYSKLGSTSLFTVTYTHKDYRLAIASDVSSSALQASSTTYPKSDASILSMYRALAASSIWSSVGFCYIPGRLDSLSGTDKVLGTGYDPATGLRSIVFGTAVAQVVPLSYFVSAENEQIYDDSPTIVPLVDALVFDITEYNAVNQRTFVLPTFYSRDQLSLGNYYVNKLGSNGVVGNLQVNYGQTVAFPGGPGFNTATAMALKLDSTAVTSGPVQTFTTYTFDSGTAVSSSPLGTSAVQLGVTTLSYASTVTSPLNLFSNQNIIGFYRSNTWTSCLGLPIYDFGAQNSAFTATTLALNDPVLIYDPKNPFLNGGSLFNVVRKLLAATYLLPPSRLQSILNAAIPQQDASSGGGLNAMTGALLFNMNSPSTGSVMADLVVPVTATVTTTPPPIPFPRRQDRQVTTVGAAANTPSVFARNPVTTEIGLQAQIPREALSGTGITSVELGTRLAQQGLGAGSALQAAAAPTVLNLLAMTDTVSYAFPLASTGFEFVSGVSYVLTLAGSSVTIRGSDGTQTSTTASLATPPPSFTLVGSMVFAANITTIPLYAKLCLSLQAPAVGTHGVVQGALYSVRLTYGTANSVYDIIDATDTVLTSDSSVPNPVPTKGSHPSAGDLYFGSFVGGSSQMTVWSVPIFLSVGASQLSGASFDGTMTLDAVTSGVPDYQLQITDSSLFIYTNIDLDTGAVGSVSPNNVYLASAVINATPADKSADAFAPCKVLMGLVRTAQMSGATNYVFVPEDDSVVIGATRYMLSVVELQNMAVDPNSLPYPPVQWPEVQYWQFANRHNPYAAGVQYTGETEALRLRAAQAQAAAIGVDLATAQEPMQMFLDTNDSVMTRWPIYEFPFSAETQSVDQGQFQTINTTIMSLLNTTFPARTSGPNPLPAQVVVVPDELQKNNPYTVATASDAPQVTELASVNNLVSVNAVQTSVIGQSVTNLAPNGLVSKAAPSLDVQASVADQQAQEAAAALALGKASAPQPQVTQVELLSSEISPARFFRRIKHLIYGFSVYNPRTGEAYLVQVVEADLQPPDQLPNPTVNAEYDPFYVRVVFLNTMTSYNMSIIVPSIAYDQYGHLALQGTTYQNVLSQTNELDIGYTYSIYDSSNNFDRLDFNPYPPRKIRLDSLLGTTPAQVFTNVPYSIRLNVLFSPLFLFSQFASASSGGGSDVKTEDVALQPFPIHFHPIPSTPPPYFVCRRQNWSADCHLMQATNPAGTSIYMAFGAGDLVPMRLDVTFTVDNPLPAYASLFTHTKPDLQYDSAQAFSISNAPYFVGVSTQGGQVQYSNFSINATAGTATPSIGPSELLTFPAQCYVVGQASTTLTNVTDLPGNLTDTSGFVNQDANGNIIAQEFQLVPYNNLVYLIRAVMNVPALAAVGSSGTVSGLLVDTFVPTMTGPSGTLRLAQAARYKRSGLAFFGSSYTPTTMADSLDTLDFTNISGETFYAPTIFIPIPELDATRGYVADLSNFLGQQIWTFVYPEQVLQPGATVGSTTFDNGLNLDGNGNPVLSLQKLHFVYDPLAVLFTPDDLSHKYPLLPKQQILGLTNDQIREGICWRTANVQPERDPPTNVAAQQVLPADSKMDRPNIIYSPQNRPVTTPTSSSYMGMSVNSFISISGTAYKIEESALSNDPTGTSFISQVSSVSNLLIGVLFDYNNNDFGTLSSYSEQESTKGLVFLNGYLGGGGYMFSSPDHFDVNDVLPCQLPLLEQVAGILGENWDIAFYNTDVSLPRQFWSMTYDSFTTPGLPNFIANVGPSPVDPTFSNRTRSLLLSIQNAVRPQQLGIIDTYNSLMSCSLHLQNGVTGSVFLQKKADRDIVSLGTNPIGNSYPLFGIPSNIKYDFFIFSRDHYATLKDASFELVDMGYAMCLMDDGSGTGTKVASYYIDADGNYYELYAYVLFTDAVGVVETNTFTVKVALGAPADPSTTPATAATPNNVNPQDMVTQINKLSSLVYTASGPAAPGQAPAYIPIQAVGAKGSTQAAPITGPPGFTGYALNVVSAGGQPLQISQIFSGSTAYNIAGTTTTVPISATSGKAIPFYGSISHGLDKQETVSQLQGTDPTTFLPRTTVPQTQQAGVYGGNGLGSLIGTPFSCVFQGSGAIPPALATNPTPGTTMKADDSVFYTYNAVTNAVMSSSGKAGTGSAGQYFVDTTDPSNLPIYGVIALPKFTLNGNSYTFNLSTTDSSGASRYTLIAGGQSFLFNPDNTSVTANRTVFTFQSISGGIYTVTYSAVDSPQGTVAPSPITLTPFTVTCGGVSLIVDIFNNPGGLNNMILGVTGRLYTYDPVRATVTVSQGGTSIVAPVMAGLIFASSSFYGYVIAYSGGSYMVNGQSMFPYHAENTGSPPTYSLMTAPRMFTMRDNYYTFDQDANGNYLGVTGNGQTYAMNPYQFSLNGTVYIINTNVQPNTVVGQGNVYAMTAANTQFLVNGVQYTIALKANSLSGATIWGQFNITQANIVVIENYAYELDTLNGQIVGNGTAYPLTTSGFTYTLQTADQSFTVTTQPNEETVTIGGIVYQINNTTVVGDGITYPILKYRTFVDGSSTFNIGLDGTVSIAPPLKLTGTTFNDGSTTYTVNQTAAFDGANYYLISGTLPHFQVASLTYTLRGDAVAITAGASKTYLVNTAGGPLSPNQLTFGFVTVAFGLPTYLAAFDGAQYYAIVHNQFTDTTTNLTFTISGNTAVSEGNSYEIFSSFASGSYFQVPGGSTYYVNVPVGFVENASGGGAPTGDIYHVFQYSGGQLTIPLQYTIKVSGSSVTISALTYTAGPTAVSTLLASGGSLTGGYFTDPVTQITYTCVVNAGVITFVDSNNVTYPFPSSAALPNIFVASVVLVTGSNVAIDNSAPPKIYPVLNNQFIVGTTTYVTNSSVAYSNATGPYYPIVSGRFILPRTPPLSNVAYTISGSSVVKGYVISNDDGFSPDGNLMYTVNEVNVVKASNQATLSGAAPTQTLAAGTLIYTLNSTAGTADFMPAGLDYNTSTKQFTVLYNGTSVTYTMNNTSVTDSRVPQSTFLATVTGSQVTFSDSVSGVTFTFNDSGNNPITVAFPFTNEFFVDVLNGVTYYIDAAQSRVEAISYLPETTQYAFTPKDKNTYLIHYSNVNVVFPVIAGPSVNVGVATIGLDTFSVDVDGVDPAAGGPAISTNLNSFEINGNLYSIVGTHTGANYSSCQVVGASISPQPFVSSNTFRLTDPSVLYTLQLDANDLPSSIVASYSVRPSANILSINDSIYIITYNTPTTGSILGQGQPPVPIANSSFTLSNPFDNTTASFTFADLNIYDAASVVGQFKVYLAPTFFVGNSTFTLDPVKLVVTDNNKVPYPLLPNPTMFSINGFNYIIDSNQIPHAIVGNNNTSPIATDVTIQSGQPLSNTTFTLNGLIYKYTEDALSNLLTITDTKSYLIAQPGGTFKLDSSLVFTVTMSSSGNYPGTTVPIAYLTAGLLQINIYAGTAESGNADFFVYKNVLYTLTKSSGVYVAVHKSYTVYVSRPAPDQQQLAVFDLNGNTYIVTDGNTAGTTPAAGINPGTLWSATQVSTVETQYGLVYGFTSPPTSVTQSGTVFQFQAADTNGTNALYNINYTVNGNNNFVTIDVPRDMPNFTQTGVFSFVVSSPLTFETGGYNAFTTSAPAAPVPTESFSAAYKSPITSTDSHIDSLMTLQGDFSLQFWHSIPVSPPLPYHPVTFAASTTANPVYYVDVDFEDSMDIYVQINNTVMSCSTIPPVFSSQWRHFALTYTQPYTMVCANAGFEVSQGANYDVNTDFSIALTFSVSDTSVTQGLLYKGTGSATTPQQLSMSYRVTVTNGNLCLQLTDADSMKPSQLFQGPTITASQYYQAIIIKYATTLAGNANSNDPYAPPFNPTDLTQAQKLGSSFTLNSSTPTSVSNITQNTPLGTGAKLDSQNFLSNIGNNTSNQSYNVQFAIRAVNNDGTYGGWSVGSPASNSVSSTTGLAVNKTSSAHLLMGIAYDDYGQPLPPSNSSAVANLRKVYLFNSAINPDGIQSSTGPIDIEKASSDDLLTAGLLGLWVAAYDPNGAVNDSINPTTGAATSTNASLAQLAPMTSHEFEGTSLYINGQSVQLSLVSTGSAPSSLTGYPGGSSFLEFNAGVAKMQEISIWNMCRQPYQIMDDMFGRLITPQPLLALYLSGSFSLEEQTGPALPLDKYIDNITVTNAAPLPLVLSNASLDLSGCPSVGVCGPLITPNLYTPPGVALTVCDTPPFLTTYSVTLNTTTGTLAGEINEAYVYISNKVLTLFAGKKVGDLTLSWVTQEQGTAQIMGYIEGAPPCPMANLTNKGAYPGATSVTLSAPTSVTLKYQSSNESSTETTETWTEGVGVVVALGINVSPIGFGTQMDKMLNLTIDPTLEKANTNNNDTSNAGTASNKLDESNKFTVKMQGTLLPYTQDLFMGTLNTLTTPSNTAGNPSSKTAILPNPNLGGFTLSNPPTDLPKTAPKEEKFGQRMYQPSPYGQAFVVSQLVDVYQQTLVQTGTVYGFVQIPNSQVPPDVNIVSFRMSSKYLRPGCLDGVVGYAYNSATLPNGTQTYTTSTGQMNVLYDQNFSPGQVGHDASYTKVIEAYQLKKQIDQEAYNAFALYTTAYNTQDDPGNPKLTPGLDFYDENVWSARGGSQEVKHTYSTSFDNAYTSSNTTSKISTWTFNCKLDCTYVTVSNVTYKHAKTTKNIAKTSYNSTATSSFDITSSYDGVESDTQMKYSCANDAHFVMNYNSMFNPNNQSGLNLVIGSDGGIYNIAPSVTSGAGIPTSDNIDISQTYTQPQPTYSSGNASGLSGTLEPYDRPGKIKSYRTYTFFLQPREENSDDFWNTVVDPVWYANSPDPDAEIIRSSRNSTSIPWRLFYRTTDTERFLPPVSNQAIVVPHITPIMAVPVTDPAANFLFTPLGVTPRPAGNSANDIEANVVLAAPTASGLVAGTVPQTGPHAGTPLYPNNVIPFDLAKTTSSIVNWGDAANTTRLTQLITSILGLNVLGLSPSVAAGAIKQYDVPDPIDGGVLYSVYTDPNGLTVNVQVKNGVTVYADVNGNPVQYYDGKSYHSLQANYVASPDGTVMYYIQPPSTYDQSQFSLRGDYDVFTSPGDEWRYYFVSGASASMTAEPTVTGSLPFLSSNAFTGFRVPSAQHDASGANQVQGYVLVQGILQYPHLNTNSEVFADVLVYKALSLFDTFPIGDPTVLIEFFKAQYPNAPSVVTATENDQINTIFATNIISYMNTIQQALLPQ